jgi:4'-phosphopantetheinyl transferase
MLGLSVMADVRLPKGIDVWTSSIDDVSPSQRGVYLSWLAPDEKLAHERFATDRLKGEYMLARALCRWGLSRYRPSVAPSDWRFERTEHGRPYVAGAAGDTLTVEELLLPSFNLSHADGFVVCALSAVPVGVDVEPSSRGVELLDTAARMFSPRENAALAMLDGPSRIRRAVDLWTVKEAYLKARGEGISVRLDRFTVAPRPGTLGAWSLEDVTALGDDPRAWQLEVREVGECTIAVAAWRGNEPDLELSVCSVIPG